MQALFRSGFGSTQINSTTKHFTKRTACQFVFHWYIRGAQNIRYYCVLAQVLTHYYGRDGKYDIAAYNISTPGASLELQSPLPYVTDLVSNWPSPIKNSTQVPDAVSTYRKILASQPPRSVAISSIGIHTSKFFV